MRVEEEDRLSVRLAVMGRAGVRVEPKPQTPGSVIPGHLVASFLGLPCAPPSCLGPPHCLSLPPSLLLGPFSRLPCLPLLLSPGAPPGRAVNPAGLITSSLAEEGPRSAGAGVPRSRARLGTQRPGATWGEGPPTLCGDQCGDRPHWNTSRSGLHFQGR